VQVVDSKFYLLLDVPRTLGFPAGAHNINNTDRSLGDMYAYPNVHLVKLVHCSDQFLEFRTPLVAACVR